MAKNPKQIIIALATEGSSDHRFLQNIIQRTFERVALDDKQDIKIFEPICLPQISGENIREKAKKYAIQAVEKGAMVLCFHADADDIVISIKIENINARVNKGLTGLECIRLI
jgi:hypothetical protein